MRLSKIKLAGFKSFVDPTVLILPGNLIGVVGPNGSGKSNIIDAINWVMGESSAKHLRGDSLADVIFNGSNTRKPVGQATVEMVFDNSDGQIGGQYANYAEISIKRTLGRDGVSVYMLNGVRCRRKDITDLFLGTGLGSRSYSVIEQGMITRVIEAKPEELRIFLEEAAGISRYKERRRETENRMRHTRENLERLEDIREELARQLAHLERQSRAAERYKALKADERRARASLIAVRCRDLGAEAGALAHAVRRHENEVEEAAAALHAVEATIAGLRERQSEAAEEFNRVQGELYAVGSEISRLEQSIRHGEERRAQLARDLEQARADAAETERHLEADEARLAEITAGIGAATPALAAAEAEEREASQALERCEQAMHAWQEAWDAFNARAAETLHTQRVQEARLEHLEAGLSEIAGRMEALRRERGELDPEAVRTDIARLEQALDAESAAVQRLARERDERLARERTLRARIDDTTAALDDARQRQQALRARIATLEALQRAAMAGDMDALGAWLAARGLADAVRLAQRIEVQPGWELALEAALRIPLDALCVGAVDPLLDAAQPRPQGRITLVESDARRGDAGWQPLAGAALRERVRAPGPVQELLAGVYAAEDLAEARALRARLAEGECVVTRDGTVLGRGWACLPRAGAADDSVLARERELNERTAEAAELERRIDDLVAALGGLREQAQALHAAGDAEARLAAAQERASTLRSELAARRAQLEHVTERMERIESDLAELEDQSALDRDSLEAVRERLSSARGESGELEGERAGLEQRRERLRSELAAARERWRGARDRVHEVTLRVETLRSQAAGLERSLERHRTLREQLGTRCAELERLHADSGPPLEGQRRALDERLRHKIAVEGRLGDARHRLECIDAELRAAEQDRTGREQTLEERRERLEAKRVEARGIEVRLQDLTEQLAATGFELDALLAELPADFDEAKAGEEIAAIERRVARLGPINLAAIEEFAQLSERKSYLDSQHGDLSEALATLEEAIRKIDRETRTRFKETYDQVNAQFQRIFPLLFGGGHAYLELTGADLLETGVTVMARPPGKRNSTIHLLSGGEKALAALALIVAIFELQPAPFCLLDEVDAPLDDANVYRFCELLKSMANRIQFMFVTHNKITMEIAEQLIGVTMQEPGVSRLVAVDMEEAVQMAATA